MVSQTLENSVGFCQTLERGDVGDLIDASDRVDGRKSNGVNLIHI